MSTPQELKPMIMRVDMKKGRKPGKTVNLGNLSEAELGKPVSFNFGKGSATHQRVSTLALSKNTPGIPRDTPQTTYSTISTAPSHMQTTTPSPPSPIRSGDQVLTRDITYSNALIAHRDNNPTVHYHHTSSNVAQSTPAQDSTFQKRNTELQSRAQAMAPSHQSLVYSSDAPSSRDMMPLGSSRIDNLTAPFSSGWSQTTTAPTPNIRTDSLRGRYMTASAPLTAMRNAAAADPPTPDLPANPIMILPQLNPRHGSPVCALPQTSTANSMKRGITKPQNTMSSTPQASGHNATYVAKHAAANDALAQQHYLQSLWMQQATQGLGPAAFGGTDGRAPYSGYDHSHNPQAQQSPVSLPSHHIDTVQNMLHQPLASPATLSSSHSLDYNQNTQLAPLAFNPPVSGNPGIFQPSYMHKYTSKPVPNIETQQTQTPAMMNYPTRTTDHRPSKRIRTEQSQSINKLNAGAVHQELWSAPAISYPYNILDQPIPLPTPQPVSQAESAVLTIPHDITDQPTFLPETQPLAQAGPSAPTAVSAMSLPPVPQLTIATNRLIRPLPIRATKASQTKHLVPLKSGEPLVGAGQEGESLAKQEISNDLGQHDLIEPAIEVASRIQAYPEAEAEAKPEAGVESEPESEDREPNTTPKPETVKNVEASCTTLEVSQGTNVISPTLTAEIMEQSGRIDRIFAQERKQDRFYQNLFDEFFADFILGNGLGVQVASWAEEKDEQCENENRAKEGI